jgi:hypothetical protein
VRGEEGARVFAETKKGTHRLGFKSKQEQLLGAS